jgi:hypothetical protein
MVAAPSVPLSLLYRLHMGTRHDRRKHAHMSHCTHTQAPHVARPHTLHAHSHPAPHALRHGVPRPQRHHQLTHTANTYVSVCSWGTLRLTAAAPSSPMRLMYKLHMARQHHGRKHAHMSHRTHTATPRRTPTHSARTTPNLCGLPAGGIKCRPQGALIFVGRLFCSRWTGQRRQGAGLPSALPVFFPSTPLRGARRPERAVCPPPHPTPTRTSALRLSPPPGPPLSTNAGVLVTMRSVGVTALVAVLLVAATVQGVCLWPA